jgi:hypothetical protein
MICYQTLMEVSGQFHKAHSLALKAGTGTSFFQVTSLMWLKTTNNYQYRYGTNLYETIKHLYKSGGIPRFYRGFIPSLIVASTCRVGDFTAYYFMNSFKDITPLEKLIGISSVSCATRLLVIPVDTLDIMLQVEGKHGYGILYKKVKTTGLRSLYYGGSMWTAMKFTDSFIWFGTYDYLEKKFKNNKNDSVIVNNINNGLKGIISSSISDIILNPMRSLKIYKQSNPYSISYSQSVKNIVKSEGIHNLFFRGLQTRLITNGIQSAVFVILWKNIEEFLTI